MTSVPTSFQTVEIAFLITQLLVISLLHDLSLVEHEDLVGIYNGGQSMSN